VTKRRFIFDITIGKELDENVKGHPDNKENLTQSGKSFYGGEIRHNFGKSWFACRTNAEGPA